MKYLFYIFQALYLILGSIPIYLAWTNQLTFRIGFEQKGKWYITITMLIVIAIVEIVAWDIRKNNRVA